MLLPPESQGQAQKGNSMPLAIIFNGTFIHRLFVTEIYCSLSLTTLDFTIVIYFSFIFHKVNYGILFFKNCIHLSLSLTIISDPTCSSCLDNTFLRPFFSQEFRGFPFSSQVETFLPGVPILHNRASPFVAKSTPPPLPIRSFCCDLARIFPVLWQCHNHSSFCASSAHVSLPVIHTFSSPGHLHSTHM